MANTLAEPLRAICACGTCSVDLRQAPKARLVCHCTICQAFTGKAFSDVVVVPGWRASVAGGQNVAYRHYKKYGFPPPSLGRGRCKTCDRPVVETFSLPGLRILFVPAANFQRPDVLPPPRAHTFYEHRQRDADDAAPRYEGYVSSQMAILGEVMRAMA